MSAAIYQKARPIHWDEVVGQEHVKDVLRPALERGRIGHAYLFSGPRGVGKTTTARLIAMTVNCEDASAVKPCGQCDSCRMVIAGRHPDVLEIDAASNNSVDDVRDLREKVALQPMRGSSKVYILDEAHMMSKSAFNALLKTLEEPPAHAVFVLATTEAERLPPTILSRCQHYRFRRHSVEEIAGKLALLAGREGVNAQADALRLIARAADGAMRDGESLLERMLASGEPVLTLSQVEGALGLPPQERITALALDLVRAEAGRVLEALGRLYGDGFAPRTITERVKIALRDLLHARLGVGGLKAPDEPLEPSHVLQLIRALDEEDGRFARASDLIALEMAFTRALTPSAADAGGAGGGDSALAARVAALERQLREGGAPARAPRSGPPEFDPLARAPRPAAPATRAQADADAEPASEPATASASPPPRDLPSAAPIASGGPPRGTWGDVIAKAKPQLKAFLREGQADLQAGVVVLSYGAKHKWHAEQIASKLEDVAALVRGVLGEAFGLELVMPDGSKKNAKGGVTAGQAVAAPRSAAELTGAAIASVRPEPQPAEIAPPEAPRPEPRSLEPRTPEPRAVEARPVEPRHAEPRHAEARVDAPRLEARGDAVQVLEPPATAAQASRAETHRSATALAQAGPIHVAPGLPTDLEFEGLGAPPAPEESLFGAPAYLQATAEPAPVPHRAPLEPEAPALAVPMLEAQALESQRPELQVLETPALEVPSPEAPAFAPPAPENRPVLSSGGGLETFTVTTDPNDAPWLQGAGADDAPPPLDLFDDGPPLDEYDDAPARPAKGVPALQGHPNYARLSKLFSHRVREAGSLEVAAPAAAAPEADATPALSPEAGAEAGAEDNEP